MPARRGWFLTAIALGILLNPLNTSTMSVAVARLQQVYRLDFAAVSWVISVFYLCSAVAQPAMGRMADLFGRRRIFLSGLLIVAAASLGAPFSPSYGWLLAFRVLQAIGISALFPAGMSMVRHQIVERQAKALAVLSMFASATAALGPTIGGFLLHWWDWRAIFFVNVPFIAASFVLAWRALPHDAPAPSAQGDARLAVWELLDAAGIGLFAVALVGVLVALLSLGTLLGALAGLAGIAALAAFWRHELNSRSPFVPLRAFAENPAMARVDLHFVVINVIFYAVFFGVPTYLQEVRGLNGETTGLLMLCLAGCSFAIAPLAGRWVDRAGPRGPLLLAGALLTFAALWLLAVRPAWPVAWLCVALAAVGVSNGLNAVALQTTLFQSAPKALIGTASGLFQTARFLGTVTASLLLGLVFGARVTSGGLHLLGAILTLFALAVVAMSLRAPAGRAQSTGQSPAH